MWIYAGPKHVQHFFLSHFLHFIHVYLHIIPICLTPFLSPVYNLCALRPNGENDLNKNKPHMHQIFLIFIKMQFLFRSAVGRKCD